jgi:hypothetical protein
MGRENSRELKNKSLKDTRGWRMEVQTPKMGA